PSICTLRASPPLSHSSPTRRSSDLIFCRRALRKAERGVGIQRVVRDRLTRRVTLVEKGGDLALIEVPFDDFRLLRLRRLGGLHRLRRRLLLFLLDRLGDRVGRYRLGCFLVRLRLFL